MWSGQIRRCGIDTWVVMVDLENGISRTRIVKGSFTDAWNELARTTDASLDPHSLEAASAALQRTPFESPVP